MSNTPSTPKNDWLRRFHLAHSRLHYELMFMVPWGTWKCFNYGYAPVSPEVFDDPVGRHEPYQIELYNQVRKRIPEGLTADSLLCEVSCGRGGGLSFLKRSLGVRVVGLDRSFFGRLYARWRFGLDTRPTTGPELNLESGSVDVVVSVEAAHNYFNDRFAQELFRILKPGGVLVITDGPLQPYESQRQAYPARLKAAGFVVDQFESIADHVAEACRQDNPRRLKPLRWIPSKAVRKELMHSLGCVPSQKYESLVDGSRGYYILRAFKPA